MHRSRGYHALIPWLMTYVIFWREVLKAESNRQPVKVPLGALEWALHESLSERLAEQGCPPGLPRELLEKLRSVHDKCMIAT